MITFNEEHNVEGALASLSWADEIVVIDSGSTDETVEICRKYTDKVLHRNWTGYVDQKNFAADNACYDWVFSLDADERPSPDLITEIRELAKDGFSCPGYRIPRVAYFMGSWIRHGDWYPDYQLRLFDRRKARWSGGHVHESIRLAEKPGYLKGEIQHYTYRSLSDYLKRLEVYSSLAARDYDQKGKSVTPMMLLLNPTIAFFKTYLLKRGFLDGTPGFMVAVMSAISVFFKYSKLYELRQSGHK